ncbi:MAG: hypothetical protein FWH27_11090, partial [Planctomycetaceae bacterium]|nr:hypothetical protein [Planctomycetaceae bacterium]
HPDNDIPPDIAARFGNRLFGCDACQSVCPFNWPKTTCLPNGLTSRSLREQIETGMMSLAEIERLDESEFQRQFAGTPLARLGLARLKRNASIVRENAKDSHKNMRFDPSEPQRYRNGHSAQ